MAATNDSVVVHVGGLEDRKGTNKQMMLIVVQVVILDLWKVYHAVRSMALELFEKRYRCGLERYHAWGVRFSVIFMLFYYFANHINLI